MLNHVWPEVQLPVQQCARNSAESVPVISSFAIQGFASPRVWRCRSWAGHSSCAREDESTAAGDRLQLAEDPHGLCREGYDVFRNA